MRTENFLAFANKLINPIIELKTDIEAENFIKETGNELVEETYSQLHSLGFISLGEEYAQLRRKHRVILVLYERNRFPSVNRQYS